MSRTTERVMLDHVETLDYFHKTLSETFEDVVLEQSNQVALSFKNQTLTYDELNKKSNQVAHFLRELGVKNNALVAICMDPSLELLISIIAILKAGGAYVPLDPDNPIERRKNILENSQATLLITKEKYVSQFESVNITLVCFDTDLQRIEKFPQENPKIINVLSDLAYVIYTSGSIGKPKGVMITHDNVSHFMHWFSQALSIAREDVFDFSSSISFDFSVAMTLFPLLIGCKVAIAPSSVKKDPNLYLKHLLTSQISIVKFTPSYFRQFKNFVLNENVVLNLKHVIFGGESLFVHDIKDWLHEFTDHVMFCEYGPTEATVATSWIKVTNDNIDSFKNKIPIGKPAINTQLYILNDDLNPLPPGIIGELYIGGKGVAKGYFNQRDLTEKKFIKDPFNRDCNAKLYKTGDLCRYLSDGNIEFVDRVDRQVKIRGFRIEMEEIEKCLSSHSDIKEVAVIAQDVKGTDQKKLVAFCVMHRNEVLYTEKIDPFHHIQDYLKKHLPDYMIPNAYVLMESLPLSASGKLDKNKLQLPIDSHDNMKCPPRNDVERTLCEIWLAAIHIQEIGIDDNFFDLGGNSLAAALIISKIRKELKKEINLKSFYDFSTIKELADYLKVAKDVKFLEAEEFRRQTHANKKIPLNELQFLFWLIRLSYPKIKILNIVDRKRLYGVINVKALNFALDCICKKYSILSYFIPRFIPYQYPQDLNAKMIILHDLENYSKERQEEELLKSFAELENYRWGKGEHLFIAKLFTLKENELELQLAISHLISDKVSIEILFSELSHYYKCSPDASRNSQSEYPGFASGKHNITPLHIHPADHDFKDYIFYEKHLMSKNLQNHIEFWENHLHGVPELCFPKKYIHANNKTETVYIPIFEKDLENLKYFCVKRRLNLSSGLCSAIGLSLYPYLSDNKSLVLNFVHSARDDELYHDAIGLFLRTDLIKLDLKDYNCTSHFYDLCKKIQTESIEILPYQASPIIVKLACLTKKKWQQKKIRDALGTWFSKGYAKLFKQYQIDYRIIQMFIRVFLANEANHYFVDVNIMNDFIYYNNNEKNLFGLKTKKVKAPQRDLTVDKNILNIWFDRDNENKPFLILSANLKKEFLHQLGRQLIDIMGTACLSSAKH